jgi:hypothetical protein
MNICLNEAHVTVLIDKIIHIMYFLFIILLELPPLWSSGQSSWLQIQRYRVRFPVLQDILRSSGSGTGSTQPREDN